MNRTDQAGRLLAARPGPPLFEARPVSISKNLGPARGPPGQCRGLFYKKGLKAVTACGVYKLRLSDLSVSVSVRRLGCIELSSSFLRVLSCGRNERLLVRAVIH
jgi:hypothetical protein